MKMNYFLKIVNDEDELLFENSLIINSRHSVNSNDQQHSNLRLGNSNYG